MRRTWMFMAAAIALSIQTTLRAETPTDDWPVGERRDVGEWLSIERLTDRAFVINEPRTWSANELVVQMADGSIVLCDAPSHAASTRELMEWVQRRFGRPIDVAINSHYHADASGGNDELIRAGVTVWSSAETARLTREKGETLMRSVAEGFAKQPAVQQAFATTHIVPATKTFPEGDGVALKFGNEIVRVIDPGPAHATDNVVTWFPAQRILFGGCMIKIGSSIGYTGDADVDHWPAAVRSLMSLDAEFVIPGHGRSYSPDLLQNTIDIVERYRAASAENADRN